MQNLLKKQPGLQQGVGDASRGADPLVVAFPPLSLGCWEVVVLVFLFTVAVHLSYSWLVTGGGPALSHLADAPSDVAVGGGTSLQRNSFKSFISWGLDEWARPE